LWKSDGTEAGTTLIKDINPGGQSSFFQYLTNVDGTLYFSANDGATGQELWKSDGTESGTMQVEDIRPGVAGSDPANLTNVDGTLFFTADNGIYGRELWSIAPLVGAPMLVADILFGPGSGVSTGADIIAVDGKVFFSADDGIHGVEPWTSDGTAGGTQMVADVRLGGSSGATALTNVNGTLFFLADDGIHGFEPFTLVGTPIPVPVDPDTIDDDLQALVTLVQTTPTETGALPSELLFSIDPEELTAVVAAIEGLTPSFGGPVVTISITLSEGEYTGQDIVVPAGVRLVIDGAGGSVTFEGHSPAFTVLSGEVIATGLTFVNSTDAPTILVQGGSLVVRNSTISETTGGARAAVEITGGQADFGQLGNPGGNTFILSGPGEFVRNLSPSEVPLIGNVFQTIAGTTAADIVVPPYQRLIVDGNGDLAFQAAALNVEIDFVQSNVNLEQSGSIALVIFGSSLFDVTQVHSSSLTLAGVSLDVFNQSVSDVNQDGQADLTLHFRTSSALKAALTALYADALLDDYGDDQMYAAKQDVLLSLDGAFGDFGQLHGSDDATVFLAGKSLKTLLASLGI
jgi:ELWxxDGT repeat protein